MKRIFVVVGTRPNFIKVTQFKKVSEARFPDLKMSIIHTGQHFDANMADSFFKQFDLIPDYFLNIKQGSPSSQIGQIMIKMDELFEVQGRPNLIIVVGDVNSTLAGALAAHKLGIPIAHLESGLRSFDRTMPEEINRILTDEISSYFFVTEQSGFDNLIKEGKQTDKIFIVGNTMIDTLVNFSCQIDSSRIISELNLKDPYFLMTMHRPATVDNKSGLIKLMDIIDLITSKFKLVFPIHPRTLKNLDHHGFLSRFTHNKNVCPISPLDYFSFQKLVTESKCVITDSGGIQEETTFLKKPCLTLRPNTERPITTEIGTNTLVPFEVSDIAKYIEQIDSGTYKKGHVPPYWDGKSTERVLQKLWDILSID